MMTRRSLLHCIAAVSLVTLLSSCEGIKKQVGLAKSAPDEFTVVSKAPLILPPRFHVASATARSERTAGY